MNRSKSSIYITIGQKQALSTAVFDLSGNPFEYSYACKERWRCLIRHQTTQSQMNENFQGCDLLFWMEVRLVVKVCACVRINRRSISINVPLSRAIPGIPFTDQL